MGFWYFVESSIFMLTLLSENISGLKNKELEMFLTQVSISIRNIISH